MKDFADGVYEYVVKPVFLRAFHFAKITGRERTILSVLLSSATENAKN